MEIIWIMVLNEEGNKEVKKEDFDEWANKSISILKRYGYLDEKPI